MRSASYTSPPSDSCSESSVILHEVFRRTLTVYVAAAGTPYVTIQNGLPVLNVSPVGHMWYSINNDAGTDPLPFGFAPQIQYENQGRLSSPGQVYFNDTTTYQLNAYSQTVQITQSQYDRLLSFGTRVWTQLIHQMSTAASQTPARKLRAVLSYRVAMARKSLMRPMLRSITLRALYLFSSNG